MADRKFSRSDQANLATLQTVAQGQREMLASKYYSSLARRNPKGALIPQQASTADGMGTHPPLGAL